MFGASSVEKRVKALEESLERIEHAFHKLEIEWAETYDKFRQLHWRVAKRAKQLEESEPESVAETTSPPNDPHGLSGRQAEIQAQILARRNRKPMEPRNGGG